MRLPFSLNLGRLFQGLLLKVLLRPAVVRHLAHALSEQYVVFGDDKRLRLAPSAVVHNAMFNVSSGNITVGEAVFFGHHVSIVTGTHDYHLVDEQRRTAIPPVGHDVIIEEGAWLASNVTVLGPVRIGAYAVVGAGAVVTEDVAPRTVVAGVPAKLIKHIVNDAEKPRGVVIPAGWVERQP